MKFSVLMSVYYKENPEYFSLAMTSISDNQSIKPDQIVLVEDGPLSDSLYKTISEWKLKLSSILTVISLPNNVGLGNALNEGLKHCLYEYVARMDSDDISTATRFENQLKVIHNDAIDVVSGWVSEFENDPNNITSYRKLPEHHSDIALFAKQRCPINHPAVMYKKSAVCKAGGYKNMMWFEDYYLWVRMIHNGSVFANIPQKLVNMRAGQGLLERRSGKKYAQSEIRLQKEMLAIGFINYSEFIRNIVIRRFTRALPLSVLKIIYKRLRQSNF